LEIEGTNLTLVQDKSERERERSGERGDGAAGPFPEAAQPPDTTVGHNPEQGRPPADHQTPVSRPAADRRKYTAFVGGGAIVPPPPQKVTRRFSEGPTGPLYPGAPHGSISCGIVVARAARCGTEVILTVAAPEVT
jgi:hypothetical protein